MKILILAVCFPILTLLCSIDAIAQNNDTAINKIKAPALLVSSTPPVKDMPQTATPVSPIPAEAPVALESPAKAANNNLNTGLVTGEDSSKSTNVEEMHNTYWKHGSLMFDKKTSEWIRTAVKSHELQIPLEILLPSLFPPVGTKPVVEEVHIKEKVDIVKDLVKKPEMPKEAPTFYLKTILYFAQENWAIWLNNKKITDKSVPETDPYDISILKISREEIVFLWKNSKIDLISPNWKDEFISADGEKYISPEKNIIVDAKTGNISFVLKPNQSLVSKPLVVVEGPAGTTLINKKASNTPGKAFAPGAAGMNAVDYSKKNDQNSGLLSNKNVENNIENLKNAEILKNALDKNMEMLRK